MARGWCAALLLAGSGPWLGACAATLGPPALPGVAEIPALEARLQRDSSDLAARVSLGVAYREAGRTEEARSALEHAVRLAPREPAAVFYLGLTYEDLEQPGHARRLYEEYLRVGRSPALRSRLRARLPLLERQQWRLDAREVLQRETELAAGEPEPHSVAVYPFLYTGSDPDMRPLGRALAEFLVTDLAQSPRVTVLERARVQALLDEAALGGSNLVDPATAVRGGRLLRAARVLQGQVGERDAAVEIGATLVSLDAPGAPRPLSEQDALPRFFEMQKRLALGVFRELGIELTAAERARVLQRPTEHLQALLAYGLGLEAVDAGDLDRAAVHFAQAVALDPRFALAREAGRTAAAAAGAARTTTAQLGRLAADELTVELRFPDLSATFLPDFGDRDAASEALGREGFGERATVIELIIRRP